MKEKKNIERLFQEKLKHFEALPPDEVWENISKELHPENKKRRLIPFWLRISGIAAVFLIGTFLLKDILTPQQTTPGITTTPIKAPIFDSEQEENTGFTTITPNSGSEEEFVTSVVASQKSSLNSESNTNSDSKINFESNSKSALIITDTKAEKSLVLITENQNESTTISSDEDTKYGKTGIQLDSPDLTSDKKSSEYFVKQRTESSDYEKSLTESKSIEQELTELQQLEKKITEENQEEVIAFNRWRITPTIAPITMNSITEGSSISDSFTQNSKENIATLSYGMAFSYALSNKINIRTGINKVSVGYNTNDVEIYASTNVQDFLLNTVNISFNKVSENIVVRPENPFASQTEFSPTKGKINQQLGYIEIPVELSYKLLDHRLGVEIIGGMSTLFLNDNKVSVISNGMSTVLGEADNLNQVHFSTNLGVGFKYEIFKSFEASLEPMFKYQLGTFSKNDGNFKPYILGLYTGLSFKF